MRTIKELLKSDGPFTAVELTILKQHSTDMLRMLRDTAAENEGGTNIWIKGEHTHYPEGKEPSSKEFVDMLLKPKDGK